MGTLALADPGASQWAPFPLPEYKDMEFRSGIRGLAQLSHSGIDVKQVDPAMVPAVGLVSTFFESMGLGMPVITSGFRDRHPISKKSEKGRPHGEGLGLDFRMPLELAKNPKARLVLMRVLQGMGYGVDDRPHGTSKGKKDPDHIHVHWRGERTGGSRNPEVAPGSTLAASLPIKGKQ